MEKNTLKRVASHVLAIVMMLFVLVIVNPREADAADLGKTITGSGKQTVTIIGEQLHGDGATYGSGQQYYWIKFKAKKDGYVEFEPDYGPEEDPVDGYFTLFDNKKKKALSPKTKYSCGAYIYYGVKKGTTYNLQVQTEYGATITARFTNVKKDGGAKQSKAKSLKKGKWVKGYIAAGSGSSRWYKVTRNSTGRLSFRFCPYVTNSLRVTIKGPGMKPYKFSAKTKFDKHGAPYTTVYNPGGPAGKGTFYIQIKPKTKTTTGYYELLWKK